ncbi:MAG: HD domain-containing protein [Clostridiales bacterium]|nr:HD domain-containing protein [Clostridiales bacterium]
MTKKFWFASFQKIRVKASLFVLFLLVSTTLIFYFVTVRIVNNRVLDELIKRVESLSRGIASTAGYNLLSQDLLGLDNIVFRIKSSNPDIESVALVNTDSRIIVHSDIHKSGENFTPAEGIVFKQEPDATVIVEATGPSGSFFQVSSPIRFMNKRLGAVIIDINKSVLIVAQREAREKVAFVFAAILLLGVASSFLFSSFLTKPIHELSVGVAELKEGKRRQPLRVYSRDELGRLTESFNEMTALITTQQDKLSKYAQDLEDAYVSTVRVLAAAIDARDTYTLGHSTRVAQLSVAMGKEMELRSAELEDLEIACLFHDVGKIKIPDAILLKKGKLDPLEHREMARHTEYGAEILSKAPSLLKYIPAVRHHHEWHDGTGYPDGISGDEIPLAAAIISLADVYDAMTSERPYREALTEKEACQKITELAGRQFHPDLVKIFIRTIEKKLTEIKGLDQGGA